MGDVANNDLFLYERFKGLNGAREIEIVNGDIDAATGAMTERGAVVVCVIVVIMISRLFGHDIVSTVVVGIAAGCKRKHHQVKCPYEC